jgi:DNA helicase-2/ATP-dependent DNA helicase PcrA
LELATAYGIYKDILAKEAVTDFGGLLFNTLRLFEKRKSVLAEYQNRFKYILVDEFQDTNFAQNKIVTLLAEKHRNLVIVGDDDQSIYKWRGASLTNSTYFEKLFPEAKKLVLNENFRNNPAILDMSYSVIQKNNPNRLEITEKIDKRLIPVAKRKPKAPEVHHFAEVSDEIDFIISKSKDFISKGKDVAVLVRTNALANFFLEKLKFSGVPYQHFSSTSIFTKPGVKDAIALLRVINNPWDDLAMFRLLNQQFLGIPTLELLDITRQAKTLNKSIFELMQGKSFEPIKSLLKELIELSREKTVSQVLIKFFDESEYLKKVGEDSENSDILSDVAAFSEKVKDFESTNADKNVSDFLTYMEMLEETGESGSSATLDPSALKIMTIHGAKGLEFDAVFIPGLVSSKFPATSRRDPFEIPQELIEEPLDEGDHHLEEERRLFYVAVTRAKEELFLTYSDFYDGKKQWKVSTFIAESLESGKLLNKQAIEKSRNLKINKLKVKNNIDLKSPQLGSRGIAKRCEGDQREGGCRERGIKGGNRRFPPNKSKNQNVLPFSEKPSLHFNLGKISYSQIDTYETCPLKYKFRYLMNVPSPLPSAVSFGTSIHNTLRDFYTRLQKNPDEKELKLLLLELLKENWIARGYESKALERDQYKRGEAMLLKFYKKEKEDFRIPKFLEREFKVELDGVTITGRIDRIDELPDGTFEVIDYKTGNSKDEKLDKNLQLSIYALACRDCFKIPISKLSLYFLADCKKESTTRNDKQIEACKDEIIACAKEISTSEFEAKPGFMCGFCEYRLICDKAV